MTEEYYDYIQDHKNLQTQIEELKNTRKLSCKTKTNSNRTKI